MSRVELLEAQGSAPLYALFVVGFFLLMFAIAWVAVHGGPTWIAIYRRGCAYRARQRNARHANRRPLIRRAS